jgi:hypothetical protein
MIAGAGMTDWVYAKLPDWNWATMVDWHWVGTTVISGVALIFSGLSLYISFRTARRVADAEKVTAWIDIERTADKEWVFATLSVKNPSRKDIRFEKLAIPRPDFRVAEVEGAYMLDSSGEQVLRTSIEIGPLENHLWRSILIPSGETKQTKFLVYHPAHSQLGIAKVAVGYWTMEPHPKWIFFVIKARMRPVP